jgi:folate-binding protein YgfZ
VPLDHQLAPSRLTLLDDVDTIAYRDDVCGVPGIHLLIPHDAAPKVWQSLVDRFGFATELGKRMLRPIGWAAFNTTRIEAGRPLLDIDIPAATPDRPGAKLRAEELQEASEESGPAAGGGRSAASPAPAGILPAETGPLAARAVAYTKCYVGQEIVARMHARGQVAKQLVGLRVDDDALPVAGTNVFDANDNAVGAVTSSTPSPVLSGASIALAYVKRPLFAEGTKLRVPAEGKVRTATVVKLPFVPGTGGS